MGEACLDYSLEISPAILASMETHSLAYPWYAIKVRTNGELSVLAVLQSRGFDPYCPTQKQRRRYSDRMKAVDVPIFPGYLFCRFNSQNKVPILSSPGVQHIVGVAGTPAVIPDEEIKSICRVIEAGGFASSYLKQGQRVRVTHGRLAGVEGVLVRDSTGDRLVVSIELLTRSASLYIDRDQVCPV
jgi:transcription antitermination factor NusG